MNMKDSLPFVLIVPFLFALLCESCSVNSISRSEEIDEWTKNLNGRMPANSGDAKREKKRKDHLDRVMERP